MAAVGTGLLVAAGFAGAAEQQAAGQRARATPAGARFASTRATDFDYIDPSLAYFPHSWQILNATQPEAAELPGQGRRGRQPHAARGRGGLPDGVDGRQDVHVHDQARASSSATARR